MQISRVTNQEFPHRCVNQIAPFIAVLAVAIALIAAPASAGPRQDRRDCEAADPDRSIKGCTRIIKRGRESKRNLAAAYINRGNAYSIKGQHDRAIADHDRAIKLRPRQASEDYRLRGAAYFYKGQRDRGIADLDMAIKLDPKNADAYGDRGRVHELKGNKEKAIADYRKAVELNPAHWGKDGLKRLGVTP